MFEGGSIDSAFEQLRRTRDRVESILQVVVGDDGVVVQDFTGRIVYANEPAARLLHASSVTALLRTPTPALLERLVIHDEAGQDLSGELPGTAILRGAAPGERTLQIRNPAAEVRWVTVRTLPMRDDHGAIATSISIFRDITELRRTADFRENLLGIASHDLRGPLSAISTAANILARHPDQLDPVRVAKLGRQIQGSSERAVRMVRDLLDFTQARLGGGIPVSPRDVEVEPLLVTAISEVLAAHPDRRVELECAAAGKARWDPDRISQVLANLLGNAITYGTPDQAITVRVTSEHETVVIAVHNHGPVIPPERLARMFEPFTRGTAMNTSERSIGLGLYIVRSIVDAHQGTVTAVSGDESGTWFTVRLPRTQGRSA